MKQDTQSPRKEHADAREEQADAREARIRELNDARRQNIAPPEPDELPHAASRAKDIRATDIREVDTTQYDESNGGEGPD